MWRFLRFCSILLVAACLVPNYAYSFDEFDYGGYELCDNAPYPSEDQLCTIASGMHNVSLDDCTDVCTERCGDVTGYDALPNAVAECAAPCWVRCIDFCETIYFRKFS